MRVLVIDDERKTGAYVKKGLEESGFVVDVANDGAEGLILASEATYDVIVLDVMLPQMDGWSVLAALKSDPELANIPVIMVTIVDDRTLAYSLGASDYLTKPIHRKRLSDLLDRYRPAGPVAENEHRAARSGDAKCAPPDKCRQQKLKQPVHRMMPYYQ